MALSDEQIITGIIDREGRLYTWDKAHGDPPTKFGITQDTLAQWRGRPVAPQDVADMQEQEAREIYRARYITPLDDIGYEPLRVLLIDSAVQHGLDDAVKFLQLSLQSDDPMIKVDGVLGPMTRAVLQRADAESIFFEVFARRVKHYAQLMRIPQKRAYAAGWLARMGEFIS